MLQPLTFLPGEFIIKAGEAGDAMYFINRGRVDVLAPLKKETPKEKKRRLTTEAEARAKGRRKSSMLSKLKGTLGDRSGSGRLELAKVRGGPPLPAVRVSVRVS